MEKFVEGQVVEVCHSDCGYKGEALIIGNVFGDKWLVKLPEGDDSKFQQVFAVKEQHLKEIKVKEKEPVIKDKEIDYEVFKGNPEISYSIERKTKRKNRRDKANHRAAPSGRR